jgi:hypothetical protein
LGDVENGGECFVDEEIRDERARSRFEGYVAVEAPKHRDIGECSYKAIVLHFSLT